MSHSVDLQQPNRGDGAPDEKAVTTNWHSIHRSLGQRMRDLRTSSGLSPEQLAGELQLDPKDISAFESGAKPINADRLLRIAKALGVRPVEFFRFSEEADGGAGEHDKRPSAGGGGYGSLVEEGLALHQAFVSIKAASLRNAIVTLAIECGKDEEFS